MPEDPIDAERDELERDASFVQESSARDMALSQLILGPIGPEKIGDGAEISTDQAHGALNDLHDRGLVDVLISEEDSDGPIYGATIQGEKVAFHLDQKR